MHNESSLWEKFEVTGPDTESREALWTLAKMTNNAYYEKEDEKHKYWYSLGPYWNTVRSSFLFIRTRIRYILLEFSFRMGTRR